MVERLKNVFKMGRSWTTANKIALIVAMSIFVLGLAISALTARTIAIQNSRDYNTYLQQRLMSIESYLTDRSRAYSQLLYSGASLMSINGQLGHGQWQQFYHDMHVSEQYPSILGLGYVKVMRNDDEIAAHEMWMGDQGFADFTVHPREPVRDFYTAITYLEPFNDVNQKASGYDMFSEEIRRVAMEGARDTARTVLSAPVQLVQDSGSAQEENVTGVLMYMPLYEGGGDPTSVEERRAKLVGYVYLVARPSDMMNRYLAREQDMASSLNIQLVDMTTATKPVNVFSYYYSTEEGKGLGSISKEFALAGNRDWQITISGKDTFVNTTLASGAILLFGGLLAAGAAFTSFRGVLSRLVNVEASYEEKVQQTKEELLALASHQLRTPASGVKQYLGILTSGMFGELTPEQHEIAQKAYDANERQIQIVNELLYVSKVDAGQLRMEFNEINIVRLIQVVVEQMQNRASAKDITIEATLPNEAFVYGDDRYLPMVLDNLVSNAVKYSYPSSVVEVVVKQDETTVSVIVTDHGVGISKADIARIFEKFNRIDNPLSHSEGGSGLGLFLAMQLAQAHGGTIDVTSKLEKGTTFTLILPKQHDATSAQLDL